MASEAKALAPIMTVKEVAEYLRIHPATVYKLLREEGLPGFRIGADWRFNSDRVDRWCLEQAGQQGTDTRSHDHKKGER